MKTTLLILTLNEIEGMKEILPRIKREWVEQIVIADGNSSDGTIQYARENGLTTIIQEKPGIRNAYLHALPYIEGDIIIAFSPDGNSIPEAIPDLIKKMREGYDMVIASRYKDGAKSYDDNLLTSIGNGIFTFLINILHGGRYTDAMNMFRAFRKDLIQELDLDKEISYKNEERLFCTKICIMPLLSIRSAKRKLRICEIPADEPKRIGGRAKLQPFRWGAAYLFQIFRELFYWS